LLVRKEVVVVLLTEAFPKALPGLQVIVAATSTSASIPGLDVGKEWWKLDMEVVVVVRIQLEVVVVTLMAVLLLDKYGYFEYHVTRRFESLWLRIQILN
jgi:hypothetical protein